MARLECLCSERLEPQSCFVILDPATFVLPDEPFSVGSAAKDSARDPGP